MKTGPKPRSPGERLAGKWKENPESGCWEWVGAKFNHGYGAIGAGGRHGNNLLAHRVAYEHFVGPIPAGLDVCHKCDNKVCINPSHLFLGTARDNVADMLSKGRGNHVKGEKHYCAKRTEKDIRKMRSMYANGDRPVDIAREFGIHRSRVLEIVHRKAWKHVVDYQCAGGSTVETRCGKCSCAEVL